ncbi:hypothetical protein LHJ74_10805 [Streptomyces sp. N2-109]|uniref:Uncharacterized protein n=1 Tax=Streptomyces gossypii TaxID=2883101 RepID=A0ABT2JRM2_9ACTN|nr:hypothetical protein [Streptomyces gossypii]MCT2590396.1 hypothetical protein [Streptomyces gossypii]
MSIPGAQPDPYQQPHPQQPPNPYQQPHPYQQPPGPPGGAGGPAQQNPYAQTAPPVMGAYGQPLPGPPVPPGPPGRGRAGWQWGLGGALVASAVWLGTLFTTGVLGDDAAPEPDLAGYHFHEDVCKAAALGSFLEHYDKRDPSDDPYRYASEQDRLDLSFCSQSLEDPDESSDSYATTVVSVTVEWHKGADPSGEFAPRWKGYAQRDAYDSSYVVKPVEDIGEEAFLVTETREDDDTLEGMTLAVRDGWMTYDMSWSSFGAGADDDASQLSETEVADMLRSDTRDALEQLRKPDDDNPPARDPAPDGQEDI